jgi:DNA polymerase III epsilon subunit-like protein
MENFLSIMIIGSVILYFLFKAGNAKVVDQDRQARLARQNAEFKVNAKKNNATKKKATAKAPVKKSATKSPAKKASKSTSAKRAPDWKPTYDGPMFAQPGEKSKLFSYASFSGMYELDAPFCLMDFETSGFQPDRARILEIAVIKIDARGNILDEFTTLINPEDGNVGRTDIHQITLRMIKNAPRLSEVVGDLLRILDSSIVVAHNARFEENFLESAFREVGIKHPLMPTIDTLWLSRQVLDLPNYKLATVIDEFGYDFEDAHTALGDVRAMANVMPEMLELGKGITFPSKLMKSPSYVTTGKVLPRNSNA